MVLRKDFAISIYSRGTEPDTQQTEDKAYSL